MHIICIPNFIKTLIFKAKLLYLLLLLIEKSNSPNKTKLIAVIIYVKKTMIPILSLAKSFKIIATKIRKKFNAEFTRIEGIILWK